MKIRLEGEEEFKVSWWDSNGLEHRYRIYGRETYYINPRPFCYQIMFRTGNETSAAIHPIS